jgi:hypothetical protein
VTVLDAALTAFEMTWDPGLRGVLIVATGVVVLCGSVYLLLATNMGARLGFLVSVAGLAGWMALMGFIWAIYGIGYLGSAAHWEVEEVVTSETADDLGAARLEKAHDLSTWRKLPAEDPSRGEAQATALAALTGKDSRVKLFESEEEFEVLDAYTTGGKKKNFFNNWFPGPHPPKHTIIQVQPVVPLPEDAEPGTQAEVDESAPVSSVVMVRDLGKKRLPAVLISMASLIVFGVACNALHRRDKAVWAAREAAGV